MTANRAIRSTEVATANLVRVAELDAEIAGIEAVRNAAIAAANEPADKDLAPLLKERQEIIDRLKPWWMTLGHKLTLGKRKSMVIGGCDIGTRKAADTLDVAGDEKAIVKKLQGRPWAGDLVVTTPKLDKRALLKAVVGKYKAQLAKLGVTLKTGEETFFVARAEQAGTLAEVQG